MLFCSTPTAKPLPVEPEPEPVASSSEPDDQMEWNQFDVKDFGNEGGVSAEMQEWVKECAIRDGVSTETLWKELEEEAIAFINQAKDYKLHAQEQEEAEKQKFLWGIPCESPVDEVTATAVIESF